MTTQPFITIRINLLFICAALVSLAGCAKTESENVKSAGIHADIDVTAEGNGSTSVKTRLTVGHGIGATVIELSSSDHLLAYANGVTKVMKGNNDILFGESYIATFPIDDEGTEFRVEFNRENDVSAPNSVVSLPAPLAITTPPGTTYAKNSVISVNWEPAYTTDTMSITFSTRCVDANGAQHTDGHVVNPVDNGQYNINASTLLAQGGTAFSDTSGGCSVAISVSRKRNGSLDPNYGDGGNITALQRRSVSVNIAP